VSSLVASLRSREGSLIAGVCSRLGDRYGVDPLVLRIGFAVAALAGGLGLLAYGALALLLPTGALDRLALHRIRGGWKVGAGVGLLVLSALLTLRALGLWFSDVLVWPTVLTATGLALLWRQSGLPARPGGRRTLLGVALIAGGGIALLSSTDSLGGLGDLAISGAVVFVGTALVFGPWWVRLSQALTAERQARIRSQERAEVAAHLHDSVLQTLALIQRRADDPREVAQIARRQERELRAWLNEQHDAPAESLAAALRAAAADIEALHGVPVEVVVVGDAPVGERLAALVAAAREALANAARFSGADRIDVFAEVSPARVEVFVRDRGAGFDRAAVPEDRRGLRESIEGRMMRHGGSASIVTAPGAGTEVELTVDVPA
jgi:phage shock protein PspC (stress-responsive transcriptional regulator)